MKTITIGNKVEIGKKLTLIAGPCVAESLEICLEIATEMKALCEELDVQYIFKASFDKANRSSVDSFRGLGIEKGLEILTTIKKELNIPALTDVHDVSQLDAIAKSVDIIQIPAFLCRQTDLLLATGNTKLPVVIKKGQFMAPEDMGGAVKKVASTGNNSILLAERGTTFGYHNLVVDMRGLATMREFAPVVFDATHSVQLPGGLGNASGGQRQFVRPLARAAAAVGIDVLFLEVHPNPDKALSDGPNSLNFADARQTLKEVKAIYELNK
jgi:2-dehydro-3-deoxyphosphooctonate aldolase (KDO 8-P synthase)